MELAAFEYHGFVTAGESGEEAFGNCLFCLKDKHFYINKKTGQYSCKVCEAKGNSSSFLANFLAACRKRTTKADYNTLARERGVSTQAIRNFAIARRDDGRWLIPYFNDKGAIRDLRVWKSGSGAHSTKGCKTQLLGLDSLASAKPGSKVWVCEGEWDALALFDLLQASSEDVVVAVPGANIFKADWVPFFRGMTVHLCYDRDPAGDSGAKRAAEMLSSTAKTIKKVNWPETVELGYDLRDFVHETGGGPRALNTLQQALVELSWRDTALGDEDEDGDGRHSMVEGLAGFKPYPVGEVEGEYPTFKETVDRFKKHIHLTMDMENALKIIFAHAFSTELGGDPLWSYLISPPGSGKTLLLMSLRGSERCVYNSTMTPQSLVSGFQSGADPSLLPQWNGKCAILKDMTEIMAAHPKAKEELYGTLRGAYDGHVKKNFGNGVVREYWLRFSLLAGVTPAINGDRLAMMGERFLKYEMLKGSDWNADTEIMAAINNITHEGEIEHELADAAGAFLARPLVKLPDIPMWVKNRIVALAQLIAALRANVEREIGGDQKLLYRPTREVGTRLAKQLIKLGALLAHVDGKAEIDEDTYKLMERVAFDTAIGFHLEVIQAIMLAGGRTGRKELSTVLGLPETTLGRALEDLRMLGALERTTQEDVPGKVGRPGVEWSATPLIQDLWSRCMITTDGIKPARTRVRVRRKKS